MNVFKKKTVLLVGVFLVGIGGALSLTVRFFSQATPPNPGSLPPIRQQEIAPPGKRPGTTWEVTAESQIRVTAKTEREDIQTNFQNLYGEWRNFGAENEEFTLAIRLGDFSVDPPHWKEKLKEKLQVNTYPEAVFQLTKSCFSKDLNQVGETGEGTLEGRVIVRNVTKELVFPVRMQLEKDSWVLTGEQTLTLSDFGLHYLYEAKHIEMMFSICFRPQKDK